MTQSPKNYFFTHSSRLSAIYKEFDGHVITGWITMYVTKARVIYYLHNFIATVWDEGNAFIPLTSITN